MASHTSASASVEASDRPLSCSNRRMRLVGADVVEVAPAYDHAEMTTVAAAHVAYELLALMLLGR
jgi:arginase family enzyme